MRSVGGDIIDHDRDCGAAAVEFALVAVLFVTLLIGLVQFGFTFFEYIQVAHAAREGVRWAALGEDSQVISRATAAAPGLDPARVIITSGAGASSDSVQVTVTYPRTEIVPIPGSVLPALITSTAEQREE